MVVHLSGLHNELRKVNESEVQFAMRVRRMANHSIYSCVEKDISMLFYFCHCCFPFSESFVRLLILGENLQKKKKEFVEEILTQLVGKYVKYKEFSKDNIDEDLKSFTEHLLNACECIFATIGIGSTREMRKKLDLETVCLKTSTVEEDYLNCNEALMKLRGTYSGEFKQSVWEVKLCTCRCSIEEMYNVQAAHGRKYNNNDYNYYHHYHSDVDNDYNNIYWNFVSSKGALHH